MAMRVLVVEDEGLVAKDIQQTLQRMGYEVPKPVSTGEEAVKQALATLPDLVLMDIRLRGTMDGIEAAGILHEDGRVPVVFLTAHSDDATLARAKVAEPFGYVVKPFEETDLRTAVEVALYKHQADMRVRRSEAKLAAILRNLGEAVVGIDERGRVSFLNAAAEHMTGFKAAKAVGLPLGDVVDLRVSKSDLRPLIEDARVKGERRSFGHDTVLVAASGEESPVEGVVTPMAMSQGQGALLVFRDAREARQVRALLREREVLIAKLKERAEGLV